MRYKLGKSSHAVFSLHYHLILVTKNRRPALETEQIRERLKEIFWSLQDKLGIEIVSQEPNRDHVHVLFKATPKTDLVRVVNVLKGVSSRYLRKEFPEIRKQLWGKSFWSDSYFLATTGQVSLDILKKYVESQGGNNDKL
ncbi:MAG: IS200/IS605 family transposase [Candidatus Odinarchaeia archaeon]